MLSGSPGEQRARQIHQPRAAIDAGRVHLAGEVVEEKIGQVHGMRDQVLEFILAGLAHQSVRVLAFRQEQETGFPPVGQQEGVFSARQAAARPARSPSKQNTTSGTVR